MKEGDIILDNCVTLVGDTNSIGILPHEWATDITVTSSSGQEVLITELVDRLEKIEERLAIINPDENLNEKYPALKNAYDHYKTVEALVSGDDNEDD